MAKKTTTKKSTAKKEAPEFAKSVEILKTDDVVHSEEVIKEVAPSIEEVSEAVAEKKEDVETPESDVYADVRQPLNPPIIEVKEEDLSKYEPDTIDEFAVFAKAKDVKGDKVWVKDHNLLKKVEGRQFTLSGTTYLGELKEDVK